MTTEDTILALQTQLWAAAKAAHDVRFLSDGDLHHMFIATHAIAYMLKQPDPDGAIRIFVESGVAELRRELTKKCKRGTYWCRRESKGTRLLMTASQLVSTATTATAAT